MSTTVATALPLLGLRITAGPVELRGITDDLVGPLADLAITGIHDPGFMPFSEPWSIGRRDVPDVAEAGLAGDPQHLVRGEEAEERRAGVRRRCQSPSSKSDGTKCSQSGRP
ncbi:MAG TPA: hypothetical protein VI365_25735 [Trebonia sp.]